MVTNSLLSVFFFFNDTATTEIYTTVHTLSLHDALPFCDFLTEHGQRGLLSTFAPMLGRRSEEHTSELQSRTVISYAVFCLKKKTLKEGSAIESIIRFFPTARAPNLSR